MSVSVSMPQLGESVTEGTVTRWLKKEGERVEADEPLLEVSTDKVDTEIPSPVAGILRGITVAEDETVAVGAELAVIDENGAQAPAGGDGGAEPEAQAEPDAQAAPDAPGRGSCLRAAGGRLLLRWPGARPPARGRAGVPVPRGGRVPGWRGPADRRVPAAGRLRGRRLRVAGRGGPRERRGAARRAAGGPGPAGQRPAAAGCGRRSVGERHLAAVPAGRHSPGSPGPAAGAAAPQAPAPQAPPQPGSNGPARPASPLGTADGPYVTPLVRKLAAEHGVDLATVAGTGVGGRIRKQDVIDAARVRREAIAAAQQSAADGQAAAAQAAPGRAGTGGRQPGPAQGTSRPAIEPSHLRGKTERMSRARQLIARRMVESLQTSAQLTTVVEVDVTAIARLRERAKADFEAREGVKLTFLPFFALAAVEALKVHPRLNASIEPDGNQVTYHDAEHLGIAVDTERGLMVPVIRNAGDLNVGGLARKIADLASRTRGSQVSPDDLAGGTFTLTNTGSRGALFDTPIINQPQVAILGTGTVVRRPVVVQDPALGEVIAVRSMVYLALSYDHRLVDGADAARFLGTVKARLEEGAFEAELGL